MDDVLFAVHLSTVAALGLLGLWLERVGSIDQRRLLDDFFTPTSLMGLGLLLFMLYP